MTPTDAPRSEPHGGDGAGSPRVGAGPSGAERPEDRIRELETALDDAGRQVERQRSIARDTAEAARIELERIARQNEFLRGQTATLQQRLESLTGRRLVRLAIRLTDGIAAAPRRLRRKSASLMGAGPRDPRRSARAKVSDRDAQRFTEALRRQVAGDAPTGGPLVSIVMLNRDGEALLRTCLPGLARTAYRDIELIVVDNASSDRSLEVLESFAPGFPVRTIRNSSNESFSEANNRAIDDCRGDLILFLNNDIEPLDPDWLGHLVESCLVPGVAAAGARLIYPARPMGAGRWRHPPLSLQHGGVTFRMTEGVPLPVPAGAGDDALSAWAAAVRESPALTAACLLVRRDALEAAGRFSDGYTYGLEDIDLCLKLRARGGRLVYDGRAALWHHESATRGAEPTAAARERVASNRELFVARWAPGVYRTAMAAALDGAREWRPEPLTVRVLASDAGSAARARQAVAAAGWRDAGDAPPDIALILDPGADVHALPVESVRVAWMAAPLGRWEDAGQLQDHDVLLADAGVDTSGVVRLTGRVPVAVPLDGDPSATLRAAVLAWVEAPRVGILIEPQDWRRAPGWGDLPYGRDLQRALERRGWVARTRVRDEWGTPAAARDDATIHLFGRFDPPSRPGQVSVLWQISHPDYGTPERYRRYDLAFAASASFAAWIAERAGRPVRPLLQAADHHRFHPGAPGPASELLFVANWRRPGRHLIEDLLPTDHDLSVYGEWWTPERLDPRYLAGGYIPNAQLPGYYANAAIVLNDTWLDMRREGLLSNRLFDAAAAGAFVITDEIASLDEVFDGGIVGYRDREDLHRIIDRYLANPDERRAMARRARDAVLDRHTFDHRAATLAEAIEARLQRVALRHPGDGAPLPDPLAVAVAPKADAGG